jgi:hypothetical protein
VQDEGEEAVKCVISNMMTGKSFPKAFTIFATHVLQMVNISLGRRINMGSTLNPHTKHVLSVQRLLNTPKVIFAPTAIR